MSLADIAIQWLGVLIDPLTICLLVLIVTVFYIRGRGRRIAGFMAVLVLAVLSLPYFSQSLMFTLERRFPSVPLDMIPAADLLVVLGGAMKTPRGNWLDAELASEGHRLLVAQRVFAAGKVSGVLLIGGKASATAEAESSYALQVLTDWGVPSESVQTGDASVNTEQDIEYLADYFAREGVESQASSYLLLSSAYHLPRAMSLLCGKRLPVLAIPATHYAFGKPQPGDAAWIPGTGHLKNSTLAIREYVRIFTYALRGRVHWSALWSNRCPYE